MATNTLGALIKEARTAAKLSQTALGEEIGVSGSDIGKAERGEKTLTQTQLKAIAKATGVTQSSLLNAAKADAESAAKKTAAKKTTSSAAKKTTAKKTTASTAKKTTANQTSIKVTASEKKLVELYRAADSDTKKAAVKLLKGESVEDDSVLGTLLSSLTGGNGKDDLVSSVLGKLGK